MSPPHQNIIDWINKSNFPDRNAVETYVALHGGKSAAMDASIDFVFGAKGEPAQEAIPETPVSPLEELQGLREPTTVEQIREEDTIQETRNTLEQTEGSAPDIAPEVEQQENVIRRLRRYLASLLGGQ